MSFGDVAGAAIRDAREGFTMHPVMAEYIARYADNYRRWPENAAIYLPGGRPPREGELFVQRDLAASLQFMADEERAAAPRGRAAGLAAARDAFYRGDLAQKIVAYHRDNGGLLTAEDLARYRSPVEPPVGVTFRGLEVVSCGAWCQGPVLLQMLALLEGEDLLALGHNRPAYVHRVTEAMKLCFADRDRYYGDPRFVSVPLEALLSPEYAAARRRLIRDDQAWPGMPPAGEFAAAGAHAPAAPAPAGGGPLAPRRHVVRLRGGPARQRLLGHAQRRLLGEPGDPGHRLLPVLARLAVVGGARAPGGARPGKRPRLTPNPALAIRRGKMLMPFGAPGGDLQPQGMLQVFLNHVCSGCRSRRRWRRRASSPTASRAASSRILSMRVDSTWNVGWARPPARRSPRSAIAWSGRPTCR